MAAHSETLRNIFPPGVKKFISEHFIPKKDLIFSDKLEKCKMPYDGGILVAT